MNKALAAAAASLVLFGLGSCNKKQTAVDPCSLLTAAEVKEMTGGDVTGPRPGTLENRECIYEATQQGATIRVALDVQADPPTESKKEFDDTQAGDGREPVEGIGDGAYWGVGTSGASLVALTGTTQIFVSFEFSGNFPEGFNPDDIRPEAEELAKKAVSRYEAKTSKT